MLVLSRNNSTLAMEKFQINVRLTPDILDQLDKKRAELLPMAGRIPTRSDVVRLAIQAYLQATPPVDEPPPVRGARASRSK